MRKLFVLVAVLGLVAGSCGGGDGEAGSCEELADDAVALMQDVIDEFDSMSMDDFLGMEDEPDFMADFETKGEELQSQADELGCSDTEMEGLMAERAGDLKAESELGQLMVESIREGGGF